MRPHKAHICVILMTICFLSSQGQGLYSVTFPKPAATASDTTELLIVGDVMMHARQLEFDHRLFLSEVAGAMRGADICAANMEFSLAGEPYSGYPSFSAPDSYAEYLADECGVDLFLLANNHVLDKGIPGLERTLGRYEELERKYDTAYTGAASDREDDFCRNPLILRRGHLKLAFLNFSYGSNRPQGKEYPRLILREREDIRERIRSARKQGADFIIALPHWGVEYSLEHSSVQQEWAELLVSEGVDLIVGSHPHVVQDSCHIKGVPVIYSTGNFISNMSAVNTRLGMAVRVKFICRRNGEEKSMLEPELEFSWCSLPGMLSDNYKTIWIKEWATRKSEWLTPYDFENMIATYNRVSQATGIGR